jgi:pimeloyl-ACP methyl ester carboxylesterase
MRFIWIGLCVYAAWCAFLYVAQRKFIYWPSAELSSLPNGFVPWRTSGGELLGYQRVSRGTNCLFFMHGNAGNARGWAQATRNYPGDVFILEYPGYGERSGSPSEQSLKEAALQAFDNLPAYSRTVVCGQSLGSGVAEPLMRQRAQKINLLVLITPFTSLADVAKAQMPLIPAGLLLKDRMNLWEAWLAYPGRSWVLLAENDEVIPKKLSARFLKAAGGSRSVKILPGVSHNTIDLQPQDWEDLWRGH